MSGTQPYIDTDRELPVDVEGRAYPVGTCWMCGAVGPVFEGAVELPDGDGGWTYELGRRCVETGDCRERRRVGATPLPATHDRRGIAGETGYGFPGSEMTSPMEPPPPTQPDAQPKEAHVDWL